MKNLRHIIKVLISLLLFSTVSVFAEYYVIIDPGHGGTDPGAGPSACDFSLYEKTLNLN